MSNDGSLDFKAWINTSDFNRQLGEMERNVQGFTDTVERETTQTTNSMSGLMTGMASALTFAAAGQFARQLINVRGEFQKYEAILTNSLQSSNAAKESMQMLADTAARTPFQLDALTGAYVKLVNQGFKPTREEVIKLGDLASSTGKQFDQLAEAVLDAQTGEFERLKEFGIKASKEGDKIAFTFKGITSTVENSGKAIQAYILSLGDMTGVKGSMEAISATLEGQVSNLEDSVTAMFNEIGEASQGFLSAGVSGISYLVQNYQKVGEVIGLMIATYGTYKAALITVAVLERLVANSKAATLYLEMARALGTVTVAHRARAVAMGIEAAAQSALNKTYLMNPYVAATAAIVGLGYAIYKMATYTTDAEKATKKLNGTIKETEIAIGSERAQIDTLFARLNAATKGTEEYEGAKKAILTQYGQYLKGLGDETTALNDVAAAYTLITQEAAKAARARGLEAATKEASNVLATNQADAREQIKKLLDEKYKGQKDAKGVSLSETYFWKIVPVVEGREKMTAEVQAIVNEFDEVTLIMPGDGVAASVYETTNAIKEQLFNANKAKGIFDDVTKKAREAFGEAPAEAVETAAPKLDDFKTRVTAAKTAVTTLTAELAALRRGEGKDIEDFEKAIKGKEAELKAAQATLTTLTGESTKDSKKALTEAQKEELALFKATLEQKKVEYEKYNEWVLLFGKASADAQFSGLIAQGNNYAEFIQAKINAFEAQKKLSPTEKQEYQTLKIERPEAIAFVEKQNVENYKSQLAEQAAGFRLVSEQVAFLQAQLDKIDSSTTGGVDKKIAAQAMLTAAQKKQAEEEYQQYQQLQADYISLQQQLVKEAVKTASDVALAMSKGDVILAAARQKAGDHRRKELQESIMNELGLMDVYAGKGNEFIESKIKETMPLFKDIADLTVKELNKVNDLIGEITFTPAQLEAMKQAGIDVEKLEKALKAAKAEAQEFTDSVKWDKVLTAANKLSNSIGRLGEALERSGGALGDIGSVLSGLAGSIDDISVSFDKTATTEDIIAAGINGIVDLYNIVAGQIEENRKRQEEFNAAIAESAHQMSLFRVEALAYQEANIFGVENPYSKAIAGAMEYNQAVVELYAMVNRLEAGQVQSGDRKVIDWGNVASGAGAGAGIGAAVGSIVPVIGTVIGAAVGAVIGGLVGLFSKEIEPVFTSLKDQYGEIFDSETFELNPNILADYGLLDDATKKLVDNWEEIKNKALEAQAQMRETFTELAGDMGGMLSDSLVEAFRNDDIYAAVDSFHNKVTSVIEDIISQLIFAAIFQQYFDQLQADMENSFGLEGDQNIVDDILTFVEAYQTGLGLYNQAMQDAQAAMEAAGYDIFAASEDSVNNMAGAIKGVTEDTPNLIAGQMNAIRINQANSLGLVRQQLQVLNSIDYNTAYIIRLYDFLTTMQGGSPLAGTGIKNG